MEIMPFSPLWRTFTRSETAHNVGLFLLLLFAILLVDAESNDEDDDDMNDKLRNEIDALQSEAEKIAAGHYLAHREGFNAKQAEISGQIAAAPPANKPPLIREKDAQGHDYAGFLAGRLEDNAQKGSDPASKEAFKHYGDLGNYHRDAARDLRQPQPEKTPPLDKGPDVDHAPGSKYDALRDEEEARKKSGPSADLGASAVIGAFLLIERGAKGAQDTNFDAHLFTDRKAAADAAQGFPVSREDAARQGQTSWAEVHPVTEKFAADFPAMNKAGRLDSMAALYSSAQYIDGNLTPAHPDERGAVQGKLQEDAGKGEDFRDFNKATVAVSRNAFEIGVGIGPDGTVTTITNRAQRELKEGFDSEQAEAHRPGEKPTQQEPGERSTLTPNQERMPNHYEVLQGMTAKAEAFAADLETVATARIANGDAPSIKEVLTRSNEESAKRQEGELAASKGESLPGEVAKAGGLFDRFRAANKDAFDALKQQGDDGGADKAAGKENDGMGQGQGRGLGM